MLESRRAQLEQLEEIPNVNAKYKWHGACVFSATHVPRSIEGTSGFIFSTVYSSVSRHCARLLKAQMLKLTLRHGLM